MDQMANRVGEAFAFAQRMRANNSWLARIIAGYWKFAFHSTRIIERLAPRWAKGLHGEAVLNFGCGRNFYDGAVNSDLFAPHRYLKGRRRPDLYWSGTTELKHLKDHFQGIICEHVIEHMLPDDALRLFRMFSLMLAPKGVLVVSFPDVRRVLEGGSCQGYQSATVSLNSMVYDYGHRFMYDAEIVGELLRNAGFKDAKTVPFREIPLPDFVDPTREPESSYVVAQ